MKRYAFAELVTADLVIDATYASDASIKNVAGKPLAPSRSANAASVSSRWARIGQERRRQVADRAGEPLPSGGVSASAPAADGRA